MSKQGAMQKAMQQRVSKRLSSPPPNMGAADWGRTPRPVQEETWRAILEIRDGYAKHLGMQKGDLDDDTRFAGALEEVQKRQQLLTDLEPYREMATKSGTTLEAALGRYMRMDNYLQRDPVEALAMMCSNLGFDPRVMGHALMQEDPEAANG